MAQCPFGDLRLGPRSQPSQPRQEVDKQLLAVPTGAHRDAVQPVFIVRHQRGPKAPSNSADPSGRQDGLAAHSFFVGMKGLPRSHAQTFSKTPRLQDCSCENAKGQGPITQDRQEGKLNGSEPQANGNRQRRLTMYAVSHQNLFQRARLGPSQGNSLAASACSCWWLSRAQLPQQPNTRRHP